jgi:hypothetical protein
MNQRERAELDRYITGNYGEDQFRDDDEPDEQCICPLECDCCEPPEPNSGVERSATCPIHNTRPDVVVNCPARHHKNGGWED